MRHPTVNERKRIIEGLAPASEIEAYAAHLAVCPECDALHFDSSEFAQSVLALRSAFEETDPVETHLAQEELVRYAARDFRELALDEIEAHLERCEVCRDELSEHQQWLVDQRDQRRPRPWLWAGVATAASLLLVISLTLWNARGPVSVTAVPRPPQRPIARVDRPAVTEWDSLKADVRRSGVLPLPADIQAFAVEDVLRGAPQKRIDGAVSPASTTVLETNPTLRWPSFAGSTSVVSVLAGRDVVARSPLLSASKWKVTPTLERGKVYRWQVLVQRGETSFVLPAPPSPPALFRVLTDSEVAVVERARSQRSDDHLLLALVYARAGLAEDAGAELEVYGRMSGDPLAKTLRSQLPKH
jgi:hypothetical protein